MSFARDHYFQQFKLSPYLIIMIILRVKASYPFIQESKTFSTVNITIIGIVLPYRFISYGLHKWVALYPSLITTRQSEARTKHQ